METKFYILLRMNTLAGPESFAQFCVGSSNYFPEIERNLWKPRIVFRLPWLQ